MPNVLRQAGRRAARSPWLRAVAPAWRRLGAVEQVRLVFCILTTLAVAGQLPLAADGTNRYVSAPVAIVCGLTLIGIWWAGFRAGRFFTGATLIEMIALVGFGLGFEDVHAVFGPVFTALFFRCLYGSNSAALGRAVGYAFVLVSAFVLSERLGELPSAVVVALLITTVTLRTVAVLLERVAEASELSASLAHTAGALISARTPQEVRDLCLSGAEHLAPQARVWLTLDGADPPVDVSDGLRFGLGRDNRADTAELYVLTHRPLPQARREALQTLAAQATTALDSLELRAELSYRASHDLLTGLPNRTSYCEALSAALAAGLSSAALFIDLDDFKKVNDTLGHPAGDALLIQVAQQIRGCLRAGDLAARLGGDEFAILIQDREDVLAAGTAVAVRVLSVLEEPFDLAGTLFYARCSIGVAMGGQVVAVGGSAANEGPAELSRDEVQAAMSNLLRDADIAMYVAKARGKNRFEVFASDMASVIARDADARQELAGALARDEFELHFQPIMTLPAQQVDTVEALIRWRHPRRGLLPPDEFLAHAEHSRLLADIDRWVIAAACGAAAAWPGERPPAVSINISPRHFSRSWLLPTIAHALAVNHLPGERLILEITEAALSIDPAGAEANLRACAELGVGIILDDFGADRSLLGCLRALPIRAVKIDRSLTSDEDSQRTVRASVELVHALGRTVVAEGIETVEQLGAARANGFDAAQGFLLARPVPDSELRLPVPAVAHPG